MKVEGIKQALLEGWVWECPHGDKKLRSLKKGQLMNNIKYHLETHGEKPE